MRPLKNYRTNFGTRIEILLFLRRRFGYSREVHMPTSHFHY